MAKKFRENKGLENFLLSIIRWGTYLILFTPLIINRSSFFPFVTPKTIYFRILVEIISTAYLFLIISFPRYRPKLNILSFSLFIFIGVLVLTSFTGINFERSFWSTFERMTGLFTQFHLLAFFIILVSVFREKEDWEKILAVSVFVGVWLSFYVLSGQGISTRGGGTIGNTSFMAAYLLFDVFFAIILFLEKRDFLRIFSGIALAILFFVLFTSSARGAVISFWGGMILFFLGCLIFSQKKTLNRAGIALALILIVLGVVLLAYQPSFLKNEIALILKQMEPRFKVWEKGWKGFLARPVFGWGPENFNVVFLKYFNSCMFLGECGSEIWFDRVHNIVLDTLVTTGVIGLLSYLFIFVVSIAGLFKTCLKEKENLFSALGMMVLLVVYFCQNLLVFDMISSYTVLFLSLGFIGFLTQKKETPFLEPPGRPINSFFGSLILVFMPFLIYFGNIQPFFAAKNVVRMIIPGTSLQDSVNFYKKALNTFMEKYEIGEQLAQRVYGASFENEEKGEVLKSALELAEDSMEKSVEKNNLDFRPRLFFGEVYFADYYSFRNSEKLDLAEKLFTESIELSPTNQQGYWHLAEVKIAKGDYQAGFDLFQKAIDLEPRLTKSHWYLAIAYKNTGQYQKALEKVKDAESYGYDWKGNLDDLKKVIEIYQGLKDDSNLVILYQKAIEFEPKNAQFWANLAASYANLGEFEEARTAAKKVMEIDPSQSSQVEEFLNNLPK